MISLCDRWHKTPAEILAMDTRAMRMLAIVAEGTPSDG